MRKSKYDEGFITWKGQNTLVLERSNHIIFNCVFFCFRISLIQRLLERVIGFLHEIVNYIWAIWNNSQYKIDYSCYVAFCTHLRSLTSFFHPSILGASPDDLHKLLNYQEKKWNHTFLKDGSCCYALAKEWQFVSQFTNL